MIDKRHAVACYGHYLCHLQEANSLYIIYSVETVQGPSYTWLLFGPQDEYNTFYKYKDVYTYLKNNNCI